MATPDDRFEQQTYRHPLSLLVLREGRWDELRGPSLSVRRAVFQEEQGVASELDEDGDDPKCVHVVAETGDGTPVGTSRMKGNQLGRLSVVRDARNQGLGFLLVASMLRIAFVKKYDLVWANAQPGALGLARIFGFEIDPELLILAGRPHHRVVKDLASHY